MLAHNLQYMIVCNFLFCNRNLASIQDREICCYSVSCKEKDNIGKFKCKELIFCDLCVIMWVILVTN